MTRFLGRTHFGPQIWKYGNFSVRQSYTLLCTHFVGEHCLKIIYFLIHQKWSKLAIKVR